MGGSGKKLGLEGGARVHQKDGGEGHSRPRGGLCRSMEAARAKRFGLASFLSFRQQLKCNLPYVAFLTIYFKRTLPPRLGSISFLELIYYFYMYLFVVCLPGSHTLENNPHKSADTGFFHCPWDPERAREHIFVGAQ